jgi:hypothetical protein
MATKVWVGTDAGNEGDWDTAANWSPSGVPIASDDVVLANSSQDVLSGLDQSAVALTSITIDQSYTGLIGTLQSDFLQVAASTAVIGQSRTTTGTLTGSKRLNLDFGTSTACDIQVYNTARLAQDQNRQPLRIKAVNASTTLQVYSGQLAVSDDNSDSSTLSSIVVNGGSVNVGQGVTLTTLESTGGATSTQSSCTTCTIKGGSVNFYDGIAASTITTLTVSDTGTFNHYGSGTITTANANGGTIDLTRTEKAKTVTTLNLKQNAVLVIDTSNVTLTNDIIPESGKILNITVR